jgi:hypothetical protein
MSEIITNSPHFFDEAALLERLSTGLKRRSGEVVFLVGAPLSAPSKHGEPGVPDVDGVIQLIRREFQDDVTQLQRLNSELELAQDRRYQAAFTFLQGRRGPSAVNDIVREAVRLARIPENKPVGRFLTPAQMSDDDCRFLEADLSGWTLNPGTEFLGKLVTDYPYRFGRSILTTNFDPLIEVAIRRVGGSYFKTVLHADGNLSQTEGNGCHVIHFHGYWYGSDTLHTPRQLGQSRPRLRASLSSYLRDKIVVVCAYGGWDDAFTETLIETVRDDTAYPEIIWTFHRQAPQISKTLLQRLGPGIDRGRVMLYSGIDCHKFFPQLYEIWHKIEAPVNSSSKQHLSSIDITTELRQEIEALTQKPRVLEGQEEDRPPYVEMCIGRENELNAIRQSEAKVIFLTGIGGQGKSTIAARFFTECQQEQLFSIYIWRDCKEESERFENQLASVVEKLSNGRIPAAGLAKQSISETVTVLLRLIRNVRVLFIFDNADHYVDLETQMMTGSADAFIEALLESNSPSRVIFTCRPSVIYDNTLALSKHLKGLDIKATTQVFANRGANSTDADIRDAHEATEGHAFWLDLLAIQVAKFSATMDLHTLVSEIRSGRGPLPENTLRSIWGTLKAREQRVLRTFAETVKPTTEDEIGEYLQHELNYGKVVKALKTLRALNLIVVKRLPNTADVLELHPLVRDFIRQNFSRVERAPIIERIVAVYKRVMGKHKSKLAISMPLTILLNWTQTAELEIAAGRYNEAFIILAEIASSAGAFVREFCRVARLLLISCDWPKEHSQFKRFEDVFTHQIRFLSYQGEYSEIDDLLSHYEATIASKDTRYISFCEIKCHYFWLRGDFLSALKWGRIGKSLKESSGVDTIHDLTNTLALAERDAGNPEDALPVFLMGRSLEEVIDSKKIDTKLSGAFYGNIGRCLHFMGQVESALICYQKSAVLIERSSIDETIIVNQGYIRAWIGELLLTREEFGLAVKFFRAAYLKWEGIFPTRASWVSQILEQVQKKTNPLLDMSDNEVERDCLNWIMRSQLAIGAS